MEKKQKAQAALEYLLIIGGSILMVALILYLITGLGETGITGEDEASFRYSNVLSGLEGRASGKDITPPQFNGNASLILGGGPQEGPQQTVDGTIGISAFVNDESGIEKVEFYALLSQGAFKEKEAKTGIELAENKKQTHYLEAQEILIGTDKIPDAEGKYYVVWDTTTVPDQEAQIKIVAYDKKGNTKEQIISIIIYNNPEMPGNPEENPPIFGGVEEAIDLKNGTQIKLTWTSAVDESPPITYIIYQSTTSGGENFSDPALIIVGSTEAVMDGLTAGTNYCFVVRAQDAGEIPEEIPNTTEKCATPTTLLQAPSAPTSVATQSDFNAITITWDTAGGAAKHVLGWNNDNSRNFNEIDMEMNTSYIHEMTQYNPYYYAVKACNIEGTCSEWSFIGTAGNVFGEPKIKPSKPVLQPEAGNGFVQFNITINATPPIKYFFYKGTTPNNFGYKTGTFTTFSVSDKCHDKQDIQNGITYYYKVYASNAYGTSEYSEIVSVIPSADGLQISQGYYIVWPPPPIIGP